MAAAAATILLGDARLLTLLSSKQLARVAQTCRAASSVALDVARLRREAHDATRTVAPPADDALKGGGTSKRRRTAAGAAASSSAAPPAWIGVLAFAGGDVTCTAATKYEHGQWQRVVALGGGGGGDACFQLDRAAIVDADAAADDEARRRACSWLVQRAVSSRLAPAALSTVAIGTMAWLRSPLEHAARIHQPRRSVSCAL